MRAYFIMFLFLCGFQTTAQQVAVLKYGGGGDWYSNPTALPNLIAFCNQNIDTRISAKAQTVEASGSGIFQYPYVHMTGHGNVYFTPEEAENLRLYLESGGFLHIDDNYGLAQYLPKELEKIFPGQPLQEIPIGHPIFSTAFAFPNGLPKIHEHDGKAPKTLGIFDNERLVLLFTTESDLGDGWEDPEVHNDPQEVREKALKMGANIIKYAFEY